MRNVAIRATLLLPLNLKRYPSKNLKKEEKALSKKLLHGEVKNLGKEIKVLSALVFHAPESVFITKLQEKTPKLTFLRWPKLCALKLIQLTGMSNLWKNVESKRLI